MNIKQYIELVRENTEKFQKIQYYQGDHWKDSLSSLGVKQRKILGITINNLSNDSHHPITTLGKRVYDKIETSAKRVYNKSTVNLIKEGIDFIDTLVSGVGYIPAFTILEENLDKKYEYINKLTELKFFEAFEQARLSYYLYGEFNLYYGKLGNDETRFYAFDARYSSLVDNTYFLTVHDSNLNQEIHYEIAEDYTRTYNSVGNYIADLEAKLGVDFFIFNHKGKSILTRNTLELQDDLNILVTRVEDKIKNWVEPFKVITGMDTDDLAQLGDDGKTDVRAGGGKVNIIPGVNSKVDMLQADGIDSDVRQHIRDVRNDLFQSLNLGGVKTEKEGANDSQSGYAKELDTLECQAMVYRIQNDLVVFLQGVFDILNTAYSNTFPSDIDKVDNIFDREKKEATKKSKIETEEKRIDLLTKKINFYVNIGKTRDEAVKLANEEVTSLLD